MKPDPSSPPAGQVGLATERRPVFSLRGITKRFPLVLANDSIDLDIYAGEIHALLGENGAGKSTVMKILYGYYRSDAGSLMLDGRPVQIHSPADARRLGIGMIFQEFSLIPALTVAENIALFLHDVQPVLDIRRVESRIRECADRYGLEVRAAALVSELSLGELQKAEILKLLLSGSKILILDEPTRVLAPHEVTAFLRILTGLRADGFAVILITHKIREVMECADRITILRAGRVAGQFLREEANEQNLIQHMFATELPQLSKGSRGSITDGAAPVLKLSGASTRPNGRNAPLQEIDLAVYPGEILGVAGISGNGQKELGDLVLGVTRGAGEKWLFGKPAMQMAVKDARREGLAFIPENPLAMASVPFMTVLQNMALTRPWRYSGRAGLAMNWARVRRDIQEGMQKLGGNLSLYALARTLSGGNLQRMVIIRELGLQPRLIVASYLTRGLDVQTALAARQALLDARENGAGILLISEDLEELFLLSDRLIVLREGRIVATLKTPETDYRHVGYLMTGAGGDHGAGH